jgi:magnesium transporter
VATRAEWIDLLDPDEEQLRAALPAQIHDRALEHLLEPARHDDEPRPRIEAHEGYVFGVFLVPVCIRDEDRVFYQEVDIVGTRERLVTVRKTPERGHPFDLENAREAWMASDGTLVGEMAYHLIDQIAEDYLNLVDALNDEIDELEDGVESWTPAQIRERISTLRHDLLHVRRTLSPIRDAVHKVVDRRVDVTEPGREIFPRAIEISFADTYDKLLRAADGLDLSRDLLASVRDYHQSKIANDQNEVMKRLTVTASLLLVPTFIVGLYGQNFRRIPELAWGFGYWWSWGWILATTAIQLAFFRSLGWIGGDPLGRPHMPPLRTLDPRRLRGRRRHGRAELG